MENQEGKLPGLDQGSTRRAREARTGKRVALLAAAVFAAAGAVVAASNNGCEGKENVKTAAVDCKGVPDCLDRFEAQRDGTFKFVPLPEFSSGDPDGCAALTPEEQAQSPFCN
ncbi:hypothetical protein HZC21_05465 [Candidatus Peregrinibacteria bacterium]|nr:hypothetical protein [Candidatus Peregrinibacteria bacterium]